MELIDVDSSMIKKVGYDDVTKNLVIIFHNNSAYRYLNVPKEVYESLLKVESSGRFFHSMIKNKYVTEAISLSEID